MSQGSPLVVLVSGLSGAGKSSALRALEDLGFEAVDNAPLQLLESLISDSESSGRRVAIGVDARTRGFDADEVLATLARMRDETTQNLELVFVWADETVLLRRFTETRRRHPLAVDGRVQDGIAAEQALTAPLREAADLVIDSSDMPLAELRRQIDCRFGGGSGHHRMAVTLVSFAFPAGLPREANMVLDARFLSNPHYVDELKLKTGLDEAVARFVEHDLDHAAFLAHLTGLLDLLLPRFVLEGKKYATVAVGCTGGRHRSVHIVERLASHLVGSGWQVTVAHRELAREGIVLPHDVRLPAERAVLTAGVIPAQAQEA